MKEGFAPLLCPLDILFYGDGRPFTFVQALRHILRALYGYKQRTPLYSYFLLY